MLGARQELSKRLPGGCILAMTLQHRPGQTIVFSVFFNQGLIEHSVRLHTEHIQSVHLRGWTHVHTCKAVIRRHICHPNLSWCPFLTFLPTFASLAAFYIAFWLCSSDCIFYSCIYCRLYVIYSCIYSKLGYMWSMQYVVFSVWLP